jgi:hypothetical protein
MLRKSSGIMVNGGSILPFTHVEGDMVHNFAHGLSIFDHPNLLIKKPHKLKKIHKSRMTQPIVTFNVVGVISCK